ncbi:putative mannosidase MNL2 [Kluyveromyces lactis]|uniref:KLLA0F08899p n=1 Tax=Kluyveromyces lactis (strain ATCC 8585 / CBS 2359 / DSM 70799 / NBRC 1267 / NRRL Y-1140 / WM37) TaxID=284590 RepID=Q6CKQ5_KLULA|nr:uncharacterized protein KLLA0_F08899g [Kluyveromyces lactis]CAG98192.1 KLLA0F08899p [Kluyveromyces lactis]|eukprot:XP_455484.1 uncharacterized protein KLLA0_F08899g [Kluyveromyces lactis]
MFLRLLLHTWRKCRSILLLLITASVLFYYTFENEIEHLNSFAYTDSLPLIQNQDSHNAPVAGSADKITHDEISKELTDKSSLSEKNKYFPILLENSDEALKYRSENYDSKEPFHPFHPFYEKKTVIPYKQISKQYPQLNRVSSIHSNALIKDELLYHWTARINRITDHAYLDLQTNISILSTDSLLQRNESLLTVTAVLNKFDDPMDQRVWSSEILGSLLAVIGNRKEKNPELLQLITIIGEMLLRSYDTPNYLPQIPFFWKTSVPNRYAFKKTKTSMLATNILEFLTLSHITNDPQFDSVVSHSLQTMSRSVLLFDIDYLFPSFVDASGCKPLSDEKIAKGDHLRESNVLKSMQNGKYIHCVIKESLLPQHNVDGNPITLDTIDLYLTVLKAYHLNNGNLFEKREAEKSITKSLLHSIKMINDTMLFQPWLPSDLEDLLLPTSIKTNIHFDVLEDRNEVSIGKEYKVTPDGAKMSSLLSISSVLFNDSSLIEQAKAITKGYYELYKLLDQIPDVVALDRKLPTFGMFDPTAKIALIKSGHYKSNTMQQGVKITETTEDKSKHYTNTDAHSFSPNVKDINEEQLCWKLHTWPFYVNDMVVSTRPPFELIESLIYLYKITEDYQWKLIGEDLMHSIEWSQLTVADTGKLVRLFYALFEDHVNIDEYVINSKYHFIARQFEVNPTSKRIYHTFDDIKETNKLMNP